MSERKRFNVSTVAELRAALANFPDDMLVSTGDARQDGRVEVIDSRHGPYHDTRDPYYVQDDTGFGWRQICKLREVEEDGDV